MRPLLQIVLFKPGAAVAVKLRRGGSLGGAGVAGIVDEVLKVLLRRDRYLIAAERRDGFWVVQTSEKPCLSGSSLCPSPTSVTILPLSLPERV